MRHGVEVLGAVASERGTPCSNQLLTCTVVVRATRGHIWIATVKEASKGTSPRTGLCVCVKSRQPRPTEVEGVSGLVSTVRLLRGQPVLLVRVGPASCHTSSNTLVIPGVSLSRWPKKERARTSEDWTLAASHSLGHHLCTTLPPEIYAVSFLFWEVNLACALAVSGAGRNNFLSS